MLSRIETGQDIASLEALERICRALGMSMSKRFQDAETVTGFARLIKEAEQIEVVRSGTKQDHT
jgi:transcriptional regulator with XRE-family HTH domain